MTKISSGYWHLADSQSGYTAISLTALKRIDPDRIYKYYGMPNDLLIKLNQHDFRVCDVNIKPVYNVGEKSGIGLTKVIPRIHGCYSRVFGNGFFLNMSSVISTPLFFSTAFLFCF